MSYPLPNSVADLVAVDPGVKCSWLATFRWSEFVSNKRTVPCRYLNPGLLVVVECPRVYGSAQQKGDQNDLIELARVVGRWEASAALSRIVYPREWKGTIKKEVMVERIKSRLTQAELERVWLPSAKSLHHNVWDSIGIGLWAVGRLQPKRGV